MNDWNKLILGEEDSQTAPVCNGTVREMIAEIDRLKGELEDTIKYCKPYGGNPRVCTGMQAHKDLERQLDASQALLADARAEVEALTDCLNGSRKATYTADMYDKGVAQARQEAAREIIQYIEAQGMIDAGTVARPMLVYEIAKCDIAEIKTRFRLEG